MSTPAEHAKSVLRRRYGRPRSTSRVLPVAPQPAEASLGHRTVTARRLLAFAAAASLVAGLAVGQHADHASAATPARVGLYTGNEVPVNQAESDPQAVELGLRFTVTAPGSVVAIRFYKSTTNTGSHVGNLWTAAGTKLASVTFAQETPSGWQSATLSKPVALTAGAKYVVSYHTQVGRYAALQNAFPSNSTIGSNAVERGIAGVYAYGAGAFPAKIWADSAYFVDALFQPNAASQQAPAPSPASAPTTSAARPTKAPPTSSAPAPTKAPPTSSAPAPTKAPPTSSAPPVATPPSKPTTGFPDASNTGVPAGTVLKASGDITTTSNGQVIDGMKVTGTIIVRNSGVTIKNTEIIGSEFGVELMAGAANLTVQDSTIHGPNGSSGRLDYGLFDQSGGSGAAGFKMLRGDVYWCRVGDQLSQGLIQDSYMHDEGILPGGGGGSTGDHNEPSGSWGGSNLKNYQHDTILNQLGQVAAVYLTAEYSNLSHVTINNSLLAGGGYTVYGGDRPGSYSANNIKITNNQFSTRFFAKGGQYGPVSYFTGSNAGNAWSGNTWADGPNAGKVVSS